MHIEYNEKKKITFATENSYNYIFFNFLFKANFIEILIATVLLSLLKELSHSMFMPREETV